MRTKNACCVKFIRNVGLNFSEIGLFDLIICNIERQNGQIVY